jgi:phosphatidylglycerophosphatase A
MKLAHLVASGCGCGHAPVAPGTVASAITLLPGALLLRVSPALLPFATALVTLVGLWALHLERVTDDPGWVVVDEVAGQLLALYGLTRASLPGLVAGFLIFRLLDVVKPGPIGWANRQSGVAAIMADDIIAGAVTAGIVWAIRSRWPALLG